MRRRLTELHPLLYRARVAQLTLGRRLSDWLRRHTLATAQQAEALTLEQVRHESLLRRRLLGVEPRLLEGKIVNLRIAIPRLDGLLIRPGELLSFWAHVGEPAARRGFVEGLELRHGAVASGIGGGLCQLSNLIYWMALHTPLEVVEHHHHGFDAFPDDNRTQPFGSGATVFYNYVDLRLHNPTPATFQLRLWLTDTHLHGEFRSDSEWPISYSVEETDHGFSRTADGLVYRHNELWRRSTERATGETIDLRLIARNHALVKYPLATAG